MMMLEGARGAGAMSWRSEKGDDLVLTRRGWLCHTPWQFIHRQAKRLHSSDAGRGIVRSVEFPFCLFPLFSEIYNSMRWRGYLCLPFLYIIPCEYSLCVVGHCASVFQLCISCLWIPSWLHLFSKVLKCWYIIWDSLNLSTLYSYICWVNSWPWGSWSELEPVPSPPACTLNTHTLSHTVTDEA